jgi:indole-3-glycerol phosphate synthase
MGPAVPLVAALGGGGLSVIAEIKKRSPSRGVIDGTLDPAAQARRYAAGGADAISVLTEPEFFAGALDDLRAVRAATRLPILRKDFILEPVQIWEARAAGADAVLLILGALSDQQLEHLTEVAAEAGLECLVEAHSADEVERANAAGARLVGINNRNLSDFTVDLGVAESLAGRIAAPVKVAESGIFNAADAARMRRAGYDAVLVGEALVRAPDPASLLAEIKAAG